MRPKTRNFLALILLWSISYAPKIHAEFANLAQQQLPLDLKPTDVIVWTAVDASIEADGSILVGLRLESRQNFSIYSKKLTFTGPAGTNLIHITPPPTKRQKDPITGEDMDAYFAGDFFLRFSSLKPWKQPIFTMTVTFLGCTERICLFPYTQEFKIPAFPSGKPPQLDINTQVEPPKISEGQWSNSDMNVDEVFAQKLEDGALPIPWLLLVVFLGGLATNLTPCVFPMIPITIRILGRQEETAKSSAAIYASGIVVTYTAIGSIVAMSDGLFGSVLAHPVVNVVFGILFIILGLGMLGFANFSRLQTIGSHMGSGKKSRFNTFMMGTGAGLVAAPCTGPILGALLIYSAKMNDPGLSLGLFSLYSVGFALPYVFLGLAASKVSKLKVSPKIQVGVKVAFAGVMFALALFYLKTPAYRLLQPLQGHWDTVGWVSFILFLSGSLVVAGILQKEDSKGITTIPTAFLGLTLFSLIQITTGGNVVSKISWIKDEATGYQQAAALQQPILVDGWADWCVACREMDATIFQDTEVIAALENKWVPIKLDLTELSEENEALAAKYNMPGLPTLVLLPSNGDLKKSVRLTGAVSKTRLLKALEEFEK